MTAEAGAHHHPPRPPVHHGPDAHGLPAQRVGALAAVVPEALLFCFDVASRGTVLEGATLEIITVPGRALCRECGSETALLGLLGRCACGSRLLERLSGEELNIKDMEVEAA